jgi:hypothetical protein
MTDRRTLALLSAGLTVATILWSPAAAARQTCQDGGTSTICQTNGSVSIAATPGTKTPPANRPQYGIGTPWHD